MTEQRIAGRSRTVRPGGAVYTTVRDCFYSFRIDLPAVFRYVLSTMRLWSLHPRHLDTKGLVALWREALLAQAVLGGRTKGYRHHPQLERFRSVLSPMETIARYLEGVLVEALRRGYTFDASRIGCRPRSSRVRRPLGLEVTTGQLDYEWRLLTEKLRRRDPKARERFEAERPSAHPLFAVVAGPIAPWERPKELT